MKKEKAFTIVELLAVIVILAVIALIAVPKILGIINNTKFKKYKIEEEYMKEAAKLYYTSNNMDEYEPVDLQTLVDNNFTNPVVDSGNGGYCKGKVIEDEKGVLKGCLKCSNYITKGCGYTEDDPDDKPVEEPDEPVIIDANPGIICGDKKEEEYDSMTECHIKSVEDLVEFTKMVNDENHKYTFKDKIVYLDKNLDIKNYEKGKSYSNADALADFDINGDGEITSLKDEMTTDKGFLPIGTSNNHRFEGTFEGNAYTIKNLMINRPDVDNVGLFGYVYGAEIKGFNLEDVNITGNNNVGGVVGYLSSNSSKVIEITLSGNITGNNYVSGIVGHRDYGTISSTIANANITGNADVYGISNYGSGIVESGTITGNNYVFGGVYSSSNSVLVNEKVVINAPDSKGEIGGTLYKDTTYGNINLYDTPDTTNILDTYLGGDNDSSGYYFDYDNTGKIVLKSTKRNPIDYTLKGKGTEDNPYLIYNYEDYKKIALMPTEQNYYKLMADIDFKGKKYYIIGNGSRNFVGKFLGNAYTLKNVEIEGYNNVGLFGYVNTNQTEIKGFNVENITVLGQKDNVGGVVGYSRNSNSTIKEITLSGTIKGNNFVSGIAGNDQDSSVTSVISNVNVTGNSDIYGISPHGSGVVESGTITGNYYVFGGVYTNSSNTLINEKVVINSTDGKGEIGGTLYKDTAYGNLNLYDTPNTINIIDTYLGGDNDSSGYYFDYDNNDKIIVKSVERNPIGTLKGKGTENDPYLIYNYEDYKKIAFMPTEQNYYKLMADIDFKNKKYYMIGTDIAPFNGTFIGNENKLKNVNLYGYNKVGMFGYNNGLIKEFTVENVNLIANEGMGTIAGYNNGTVIGINIISTNVTGVNDVGGITGISYGTVKEIAISGNISGTKEVSGTMPQHGSSKSATNVLANVTIKGVTWAIGLTGTGILEFATITGSSSVYGIYGDSNSYLNDNIKVSSKGGKTFPAAYYNNLSYYGSLKNGNSYIIDTPYSGDTDNSGYWFDYNDYGDDIIVVKAGSTATNPNVNPNNPEETSEPTIVHEKTTNPDKPFPECKVTRFDTYGRGFTASYSCTDEESVVEIKHIYWVKADVDDYDSLVEWTNINPGTYTSYSSVWTESSAAGQGITPPYPNNCYYFYYGAKNQAGNERIYRTGYCLSY